MATRVRAGDVAGQAKRIRRQSGRADGLSPSLESEISEAMEYLQGSRKAEGAAKDLGLSRTAYYELIDHPLDLTLGEFLRLLVKTPDHALNGRIRAHLAALDAYKSFAEHEAQHIYDRIQKGQRALFGGDR